MSAGDVLVDDHLLLRVLLDDEPADLRPEGGRIAATGLWYHRLCRALGGSAVAGSLSRALGRADGELGAQVVQAVTALPESVGLVSLRQLAWPMAGLLDAGVRLNLMSLEALASAQHLDAEICLAVADENPTLLAAAAVHDVATRLIGP